MNKAARTPGLLILIGLAVAMSAPSLGAGEDLHRVWAIQNAKVLVTPLRPPVEKTTIIIRDGLIEAVGTGLPVPPDAEIIDGTKLAVFPGLVDALGQGLLKLPEEKFDTAKIYSGEYTDKDRGITPELRAFDYVNLGKAAIEKYHKAGVMAVQVLSDKGTYTGQASVFSMGDPDKNKALLLKDTCLGIGFSPAGLSVYPGSLMGAVAYLRQSLSDAQYFDMSAGRWRKEMRGLPRQKYNPQLEVLSTFALRRKPVIFLCKNQHDIRRAIGLADEFKLDYLVADVGGEAWRVIPELQKAKARVLCTVSFKAPMSSIHTKLGKEEREKAEKEIYPKNPARLAEAGIAFAFSSLGTDDPKSFMEGIQKAVEAGLPRDKALEALTTTPAAFLGLDRALGTVEPGKVANLVLAEADILAKEPKVRIVFADGDKVDLKESKAKEGEKPAVNISGRWEITAEGIPKLTVDVLQEEAAFSGKMTTPFGVFDFTAGTVSANEIYFEMNITVGGQSIDLYFSAAVEGDTMRGTIVQGTSGSAEFTAKRIPG
jgi:imidazolonepropionase-like amidohydrolase